MIQPHLPIRLPCYDFTPVIGPTFGSSLLAVGSLTSGVSDSHGVTDALQRPGIVAVSSLWSYMPDEGHPWLGLKIYEFMRDTHLWMQSFKRPELSVRGLVFAYNADYGRKVGYRVDIIRGEDGSMALGLKQYGRIGFVRSRKARAVTGYGTVGADGSFLNSFRVRIVKYLKGMGSYFTKKDRYRDDESNLVR